MTKASDSLHRDKTNNINIVRTRSLFVSYPSVLLAKRAAEYEFNFKFNFSVCVVLPEFAHFFRISAKKTIFTTQYHCRRSRCRQSVPSHNCPDVTGGVVDGTVGKSACSGDGSEAAAGRDKRAFSGGGGCGAGGQSAGRGRPNEDAETGRHRDGAEHVDPRCRPRPLLVRITAALRRLIAIARSAIKQELRSKLTAITAATPPTESTRARTEAGGSAADRSITAC